MIGNLLFMLLIYGLILFSHLKLYYFLILSKTLPNKDLLFLGLKAFPRFSNIRAHPNYLCFGHQIAVPFALIQIMWLPSKLCFLWIDQRSYLETPPLFFVETIVSINYFSGCLVLFESPEKSNVFY